LIIINNPVFTNIALVFGKLSLGLSLSDLLLLQFNFFSKKQSLYDGILTLNGEKLILNSDKYLKKLKSILLSRYLNL